MANTLTGVGVTYRDGQHYRTIMVPVDAPNLDWNLTDRSEDFMKGGL
jgi:hypothetical protein